MDIKRHKFIILGSDHSNTLGQIRCLGEMGINPIVIITEKHPYIINKSKYIGEYHIVDTIYNGPQYVLKHYSQEEVPPFIFTDRDDTMCAIDDYYDELTGKFIFWNAGGKGKIRQLVNKETQMALAKECGLNVIPTKHVKRGEIPQHLQYPIFTKATNSLNPFWKANVFICHNNEELRSAYSRMGIDEVLLQKYIHRKDEMPIEGISIDGGREVKLFVKKTSQRFANNGFGIYSFLEVFDNEELEGKVSSLIKKAGYTGIFEIEFIIDKDGSMYFLEINFRNTMFNHACADFGTNMLYLFAKSILEDKIDWQAIQYKHSKHSVMYEFDDLKHSVIHGKLPFWKWIKDFLHTDSYLYIDKRDMGPFWSLIWHKITEKIKKRPH
jgi:D-aspartate ligase